jgi:hypothetical protein
VDQRERAGDLQEGIREAVLGFFSGLWTALPCIVQSVNLAQGTCNAQPTIQAYVRQPDGSQTWVTLPILQNVPIVFPCAGDFALTLPIAEGDEVLVIFASRNMRLWWKTGEISIQPQLRKFNLTDGFAIPGPRSIPNVLSNISANTAQLRSKDGSTYIEIAAGGIVNIVAPGGLNVNGSVVASGEVTGNGITLSTHTHGGVSTGGGETGPPVG